MVVLYQKINDKINGVKNIVRIEMFLLGILEDF